MLSIPDFWSAAREAVPALPEQPTDRVWPFGATPEQADSLLELVLAGVKTGTASYFWDYETDDEPLPVVGDYDIVLDGSGSPRAVLVTESVEVVPFNEVTAEHAHAEGEDDRTLESWRRIHKKFYEDHVEVGRPFADDMPMVCERFRVLYPSIPAASATPTA